MIPGRTTLPIIWLLAAFCLFAGCSVETGSSQDPDLSAGLSYKATVTGIIDGDTLRLSFPDGRTETLRILGIDTPEVTPGGNDPGKFDGITDPWFLSLWGEEAALYAHQKLDGQVVTIECDRDAGTRDPYGRLLATLTLPDGSDYGEELLMRGLARVYTQETFTMEERYLSVQNDAIDARTGIWSGREPAHGTPGQIVIEKVHYDAAGDDRENLNDEYLTIRNSGTTMADLTSWQVRDEDGFSYVFPAVSLSPGETLDLHTGNGTPLAGELFMGSPVPVLNNDADTVTLSDREGNAVSSISWG
jgi:micrococcal nuclease